MVGSMEQLGGPKLFSDHTVTARTADHYKMQWQKHRMCQLKKNASKNIQTP